MRELSGMDKTFLGAVRMARTWLEQAAAAAARDNKDLAGRCRNYHRELALMTGPVWDTLTAHEQKTLQASFIPRDFFEDLLKYPAPLRHSEDISATSEAGNGD